MAQIKKGIMSAAYGIHRKIDRYGIAADPSLFNVSITSLKSVGQKRYP